MTLRLILGIDPGQTGAIALLADGEPAGFIDIPTREREKGGGRMVSGAVLAAQLRGVLQSHAGAHLVAVTERVQAMPSGFRGRIQGSQSTFRLGQADGIIRGVLEALSLTVLEVEPQTWKRHHALLKTDKGDAIVVARVKYPRAALSLLRKKDSGRADALLIAAWAIETEAWVPPVVKPARRARAA